MPQQTRANPHSSNENQVKTIGGEGTSWSTGMATVQPMRPERAMSVLQKLLPFR
ncbi:hypothetical protein GALMADRAFT_240550 [Galerina marginata CBS 339.88]|uniref:Uncharacterized protein n=1 Tax=Galerina marginata (strain CBS 339.88) TaxID=685588 RepID=A0A067TQ89_GALM3|nr:hypothetical protein GALMADRAFT_240550 [Galerina marginata CBS 339.88]